MFENLSENLGKIFDKLKGRGFLSEDDVSAAMREVRIALLEADVALPVVKEFITKVKEKAIGSEVLKSITPAQMVIKIVQDELAVMLGSDNSELSLSVSPPAIIMMVGLQGSGKTTTSAKIALRLREKTEQEDTACLTRCCPPSCTRAIGGIGEAGGRELAANCER